MNILFYAHQYFLCIGAGYPAPFLLCCYRLWYRRVKTVNELVVNGVVYDEKRALFEFKHKLCATIDCHEIEVGLDENSYSYINFDGEIVKCKKRLI